MYYYDILCMIIMHAYIVLTSYVLVPEHERSTGGIFCSRRAEGM